MAVTDTPSTDFEYRGYLLFNGLYRTKIYNKEIANDYGVAEQTLSKNLPHYDANDPGSEDGYERIPLTETLAESPDVDEDLAEIADQIISYRYVLEDRNSEDAYYQGRRVHVEVPHENDSDIYWFHPDYVFLRGAKEIVNETREKTIRNLADEVDLEPVRFDPDFLLWLYWKRTANQPIPAPVGIDYFTDSIVSGDRDPFGKTNSVDDSTNLGKCVPVIAGVLKGKSIIELEGYFDLFDEHKIKAKLTHDGDRGRVHIKASAGDVATAATDERKMALALNFVKVLTELHDDWQKLPQDEKYPPRDFFESLYETARDQGVDIESISEDVLREYAIKRGLSADAWL